MKIKQIIWAIVTIGVVFSLVSLLKGDTEYIKNINVITQIRSELVSLAGVIKDEKNPSLALKIKADDAFKESITKELKRSPIIKIDSKSEYQLNISVQNTLRDISTTISLLKGEKQIYSNVLKNTLGNWTSLLPPLLAIILAICLRKVFLSLSIAILFGAMLSHSFNPFKATWYALTEYFWKVLTDEFCLTILGFVFVLVGLVNIINRGGGMAGVINQITKIAKGARTACLSVVCMGMLIFFDDYTNSIVVGTTMRSFTDKMKVSREKLSYLVDSTAAPLAGLALLSTWIGFEVLQFQGVSDVLGLGEGGYSLFIKALPYRFYCIFTIVLAFMISILRRDFGPMLKAEKRAYYKGEVENPDSDKIVDSMIESTEPKKNIPERWYNAALPILSVLIFILAGILWRGTELVKEQVGNFNIFSFQNIKHSFLLIGGDGNILFTIMFLSACFGIIVAILLFFSQRILTLKDIAKAFFSAWRVIPVSAILVLAWSIHHVASDLGTAFFLSSLVKDVLNPVFLPLVIFLVSAFVSFSTGTSFGTMGLVIPTIAPLAFTLGSPFILIMSLGAVLDGAIFGDHCSPISDTTVLSSLASSCDLTDHVRTQMPYAILGMIVAGLIGYLPAAYGVPVYYLYAAGFAFLLIFMFVIARKI